MRHCQAWCGWLVAAWVLVVLLAGQDQRSAVLGQQPGKEAVKSRTFLFTYRATLSKLPAGKTVKVWLPVPVTTADQDVVRETLSLPGKASEGTEPRYGNTILFFEATPDKDGKLALSMAFKVTRREVKVGDRFRKPGDKEKRKEPPNASASMSSHAGGAQPGPPETRPRPPAGIATAKMNGGAE